MTKIIQHLRRFGIGVSMAGIAVLGTTNIPILQNSCAGACGQCSACGLAALPVVLWLAEKRWNLTAKIRIFFTRPIVRQKEYAPSGIHKRRH